MAVSFALLGLVLMDSEKKFLSNYFFIVSVLTLFFYPFYSRRVYRKHYEKHIVANYHNRFGVDCQLWFEDGYLLTKSDTQEGKLKLSEIESINEIAENVFVRVKTGESLIIPKSCKDFESLKNEFQAKAKEQKLQWNVELEWKWR